MRPRISTRPAAVVPGRVDRRLRRAEKRFARTESAVESCLARVRAAESALVSVIEHPDLAEVSVQNVIVPRTAVADMLAVAQYDLAVAVRRHRAAAAQVRRHELVWAAEIARSESTADV